MKFFSTPAWSFGGKSESLLFKGDDSNPGPGTYDLRAEEIKVPSSVFGQAKRPDLFQKSCTPGPPPAPENKRKEQKSQKSQKYPHLKDKQEKIKISQPDRPNDDPKKPKTTISYSFGNKVYAIPGLSKEEIGPGQYDPNFKAIQSSRATTFGAKHESRSRLPLTSTGPGPGSYEINSARTNSVSFGKSIREGPAPNYNPGPNQYSINRELSTSGKSLTARRPLPVNKDKIPGPGAYDLRNCFSSPAFAVVSGKRTNFIQPGNNPGPGEYDPIDGKSVKAVSFTKGLRPGVLAANKTELIQSLSEKEELEKRGLIVKEKCHGKIEVIDEDEANRLEEQNNGKNGRNYFDKIGDGPKVSFSGRRYQQKSVATPGPGQYETVANLGKGVRIGNGVRSGELRTFRNRNPGPGAYSQAYLPKGASGGWSFGKDPRSRIVDDDEPGPGHYDLPSVIPDVPKYLILQSNLSLND
jgi:hypothetical protein